MGFYDTTMESLRQMRIILFGLPPGTRWIESKHASQKGEHGADQADYLFALFRRFWPGAGGDCDIDDQGAFRVTFRQVACQVTN